MKHIASFLLAVLLNWAALSASAMQVVTVLSNETITCTDTWQGWLTLSKAQLADAQAGDGLVVTVTACSTNESVSPLLDIRNGSWTSITPYTYMRGKELPYDVTLTLTDEMIQAINGNVSGVNSGLVITGCGITFNKVALVKNIELQPTEGKGDAMTNLWTGNEKISWLKGLNNSVKLDGSAFANAKSGMRLRMTFSDVQKNGVGRILHNWTSFSGLSNAKLTTDCTDYYEYTLTDDMLTSLQADGLRVSGVGYTLTSIDLVDPDKEYTISCQCDNSDIKAWEPDETPNITLTLTNLQDSDVTIPVTVNLTKDVWENYKDYAQSVTLAAGETKEVTISFELEPGFYRMAVNANNRKVCTYWIGFDPRSIVSPDDAQPDFWEFWDEWKERLASIDIDAQLTELTDQSTANRKVYEVKMQSAPDELDGTPVTIWGYYAEPVAEGKHPTLIRYQGTDNGSGTPTPMGGDDNPDWCELIISTRGQMLSRVRAKEAGSYVDYYGTDGFYAYEYGDKDKHYYRAAYLDCLRAIDFVRSREKVDTAHIFAAGGSQGGCFTYVAAGLSGKLRAIAPSITGHADFPDTKRIVTWPTNIFTAKQAELGWTDEQVDSFNSYFDTKNFASRITCPVITNFSLQDHTDGPHLNIAPFNLLNKVDEADKAFSINAFKGHATADDWNQTYMAFFQKYIDMDNQSTTGIARPQTTAQTTDSAIYDLTGRRIDSDSLRPFQIYIKDKKKWMNK
jgi:cephalosporin-C deacetylase-like acetyl esterase